MSPKSHECAIAGCKAQIPGDVLFCNECHGALPKELSTKLRRIKQQWRRSIYSASQVVQAERALVHVKSPVNPSKTLCNKGVQLVRNVGTDESEATCTRCTAVLAANREVVRS